MTEAFDQILLSPGLYWIAELIFVELLDSNETFVNCELVCKKWQNFFIQASLWKRRLFQRIAKVGSYRRSLLEKYPEWTNTNPFTTLMEEHVHFRSLAFKFSKKSIQSSWRNNNFSIKRVPKWTIVRDLTDFNGEYIIVAENQNIHIANRQVELVPLTNVYSSRREITSIAFDKEKKIIVTGGRDRMLSKFKIEITNSGVTPDEKPIVQNDAHSRLITSVKIDQNCVFSSSRDRSVKVWDLGTLNLLQTLVGHHGHSVWDVDIRNNFLVTASADKNLNVWKNDSGSYLWSFRHKMNNDEALRNVIILKKCPYLALSGDLIGDLKVWNLNSGSKVYQVPDPSGQGMFRQSGGVVSLSQTEDLVATAFSDKSIALFSTSNFHNDQFNISLEHLTSITIEPYLDGHSFIRNIFICDGQVYICNVSSDYGIIVLNIWE